MQDKHAREEMDLRLCIAAVSLFVSSSTAEAVMADDSEFTLSETPLSRRPLSSPTRLSGTGKLPRSALPCSALPRPALANSAPACSAPERSGVKWGIVSDPCPIDGGNEMGALRPIDADEMAARTAARSASVPPPFMTFL